ncbi:hypothetical protein [Nocardioides convexus]|uniref:hypothetical protein n=1 Tax=Nocardioides convexus TaxID=2712224 RepID=UPI0031010B97
MPTGATIVCTTPAGEEPGAGGRVAAGGADPRRRRLRRRLGLDPRHVEGRRLHRAPDLRPRRPGRRRTGHVRRDRPRRPGHRARARGRRTGRCGGVGPVRARCPRPSRPQRLRRLVRPCEGETHDPRPRRPVHRRDLDQARHRRGAGGGLAALRGGRRAGPRGHARRHRRGGRRCPEGLRRGPVAADEPRRADRGRAGPLRPVRRPPGGDGDDHLHRDGLADLLQQPGPGARAVDADRGLPGHRPGVPLGVDPPGRARCGRRRTARAGRGRRRHPAVERPAVHSAVEVWSRRCSPAARWW